MEPLLTPASRLKTQRCWTQLQQRGLLLLLPLLAAAEVQQPHPK